MAPQRDITRLLALAGAALAALLGGGLGCAHRAAYTSTRAADEDTVEVTAPRLPAARVDERRARRADTLRSLSAELEDRARGVARAASGRGGERGHSERELRESTRLFADEAGELRGRLDRDDVDMSAVRDEVSKLNRIARRVEGRLREARVADEAHDAWRETASVLDEVNRAAFSRRRPGRGEGRRGEPEPDVVIPREGFDDGGR